MKKISVHTDCLSVLFWNRKRQQEIKKIQVYNDFTQAHTYTHCAERWKDIFLM